jgi:hypothetical protein
LPDDGADSAEPLWWSRYPAFPTVLVVLSPTAPGARSKGRRSMLLALLADEDVADFRIDVCLLEDLMADGSVRADRPQRTGAEQASRPAWRVSFANRRYAGAPSGSDLQLILG